MPGVCVSEHIHTVLDWNDHPSSTRNDNRCVCLGLQNLSGHCHYLCKLLRRNEVLWPYAFSSNSWIGAASLPTQVFFWCRYKFPLLAVPPTQPWKKRTSQIFLGPWCYAKKLLKLKWAKFTNKARSMCTECEQRPSKVLDTTQPRTLQCWLQHSEMHTPGVGTFNLRLEPILNMEKL